MVVVVLVAQFSHENDWVETGILSQGVWDQLEGLTECAAAVRVVSEDLTRVLNKSVGDFHLNARTAWHKGSFLDEGTHNTEGIVEGTVSLLEHELVGTTEQHGDSFTLVGATGNLNDLG